MLHTLIQPLIDLLISYWYAVLGLVGPVLLFVKFQIRILDWIDDLLD